MTNEKAVKSYNCCFSPFHDCSSISAVGQPTNIFSRWKKPRALKGTREAVGFIHCLGDEWHLGTKLGRRKWRPRLHSVCGFSAAATAFAPNLDASRRSSRVSLQLHFCVTVFPDWSTFLCTMVPRPSPPLCLSTATRRSLTVSAECSRLLHHRRAAAALEGHQRSRCLMVMWQTGPPQQKFKSKMAHVWLCRMLVMRKSVFV